MKFLYLFLFLILTFCFVGCNESNAHQKIKLLGEDKTKVNPNSMAYLAKDKEKERQNKVALTKIETDAKIKIAEIQSENKLSIAKLNADVKKKIAESDATIKMKTTQLELKTKEQRMRYTVYIVIVAIVFLMTALILLYLNSKKNRELQKKLHEEKLKHEQFLREKELEEQRFHKIIDLVATGKLPEAIEKEVILSISHSKSNIINNP